MTIYVDIDETICKTKGTDYVNAVPMPERIQTINNLYDIGNTIVYWTARGTVSGIDFKSITEVQLTKWGAKYHELKFGKPAYDLFIDDKNVSSKNFFKDTVFP